MSENTEKKSVLFLCTGNSARSQMAEGLVNHFLGERWKAYSAGTKPTGQVHPLALEAMTELGIDISQQRSKSVDLFRDQEFDSVITVCDDAAKNCPVWLGPNRSNPCTLGKKFDNRKILFGSGSARLGKGNKKHLGFPNPVAATGSKAERLDVFRRVRDGLRQETFAYLDCAES
jgi:arsenate reductase (thioredoxin)